MRTAVMDRATPKALSGSFSRALEHTLIYEIAVFALVSALCFALPRRNGGDEGRETGNQARVRDPS